MNVWSWPDGELLQSLSESAQQIAVSSQAVVAQRTQNEIRLRALPDLALLQVIPQSNPMAFSPDGYLIEVGRDLYEIPSGTLVRSFPAEPGIQDAIFSPDGSNVILSASRMFGQEIERFDLATGDPVSQFGLVQAYASFIGSFSFSPEGSRLADFDIAATLRTAPSRLRIWDGFGGLFEYYSEDLGFGGGWVRYSPDGSALAVALDNDPINGTRVFGVALDPCADGTCIPNRLPGR